MAASTSAGAALPRTATSTPPSSSLPRGVRAALFTYVAHALAVAAAAMVLYWCIHFRGGLAFEAANKNLIFNFLEAALKKKRSSIGKPSAAAQNCPQSLVLRVINWVEQSGGDGGSGRKAGHPRAAAIARKLRIKAKNP